MALKWSFPNVTLGENNTVKTVSWVCSGPSSSMEGCVTLDDPDPKRKFVPYEKITNELMEKWIIKRFPEIGEAVKELEKHQGPAPLVPTIPHFK